MARTTEPHSHELDQFVGPRDEIITQVPGLTGWSMNWWYLACLLNVVVFGLFAVLRGMRGASISLGYVFWACMAVGALLGVSMLTRPALVVAVTRQRQVLCRRIARPLPRKTFAQAPLEAVQLTQVRDGWFFSELRYNGPGTNGGTVRLKVARPYRGRVQKLIAAASGQTGT